MKAKIAFVAALALIATTPAQGAGRSIWATYDECVAWGESAGSGTDPTFVYACVPTTDGQWELVWTKSATTREKPQRGGQGLLKRAAPG